MKELKSLMRFKKELLAKEVLSYIDKINKLELLNKRLAKQLKLCGVIRQSEQLVCVCGSDDIDIEPKVYNCMDCGKSWT